MGLRTDANLAIASVQRRVIWGSHFTVFFFIIFLVRISSNVQSLRHNDVDGLADKKTHCTNIRRFYGKMIGNQMPVHFLLFFTGCKRYRPWSSDCLF